MKLRIFSDIHIEFMLPNVYCIPELPEDSKTILILAGDITLATKIKEILSFFGNINERFKSVIYINGNHEFYGSNIREAPIKIKDALNGLYNINYVDNEIIEIEDVIFICSTLWVDFDKGNPTTMLNAMRNINDYRLIRHGPKNEPWKYKLKPIDILKIYIESKKFIFDTIANIKNKKIVVISHHGPSTLSISEIYKGNYLNGCFISDLFNEIYDNKPNLWIHGHLHESSDYKIGETRVICNPYGYFPNSINPNFNDKLIIEV